MTTHVNFEIAKLLKDKGFDNIECDGYYRICDGYTKGCKFCYSNVSKQDEEGILAPTIAEVVMWLYRNHRIWIEIRKSYLLNQFVAVTKNPRVELSSKDTPTEAYESAIEYTLKILI